MRGILLAVVFALSAGQAWAGSMKKETAMNPDDMTFVEIAKGARQAVLWGDPAKGSHGAITKFDEETVHPMHHHTSELKIVMIEGEYWMEVEGGKRVSVGPGGFMVVPAKVKHASGCEDDCMFFQTAAGKFDLVWAAPPGTPPVTAKK